MSMTSKLAATLLAAFMAAAAMAQSAELKLGYPERYTVVEGDTLWGIAGRFLKNPWEWPKIWRVNEQIENPHLIYPGDVLVMTQVEGAPQLRVLRRETVKLSPTVREQARREAIPTIPPNAIYAFLTAPLVIDADALDDAPYIARGVRNNVLLGKYQQFYARGLTDAEQEGYQLFRPGLPFIDPDTEEVLGHEAKFLGTARVLRYGDPAKLEIVSALMEINAGDRLQPITPDLALPHYFPHAPDTDVRGRILSTVRGVAEVGPFDVVAISLGTREGIEEGHVLRIMRSPGEGKDPVTGKVFAIPDESAGLMIVFRPFERVSYALILNTDQAVHIGDVVQTP